MPRVLLSLKRVGVSGGIATQRRGTGAVEDIRRGCKQREIIDGCSSFLFHFYYTW